MFKFINFKIIQFNKSFLRRISYQITNDLQFGREISKIRNIGMFAHIDAGKTTTTERMLFYAGFIHNMGEVHHGNTVTDYMDQERERGITIRSAAVTFRWRNYFFNLIDTPGHIDFTMEVEQSLNILDGAIIIIDGSAGVEAQTLTVWKQANRYQIPRIIYVNKMDKPRADIENTLKSISEKLNVPILMLQIPIYEKEKFVGVTDLITMNNLIWDQKTEGKNYSKEQISKEDLNNVFKERNKLIDLISNYDDIIAETIINRESYDSISTNEIIDSIRRITLSNKGVPVLCGSSYKNTGVQLLMDAIINYLPSPDECNKHIEGIIHNNLCAKVFKIIHDDQRKPITYFRIYSGNLNKGQKLYNMNQEKIENVGKLAVAFADELKEMNQIHQGNIAAVYGLKWSKPGDFITDKLSTANFIKEKFNEFSEKVLNVISIDTKIPDPVFFCSVEVTSEAYQKKLEEALNELQREDPSLKVNFDNETGQTILGGMGELHLEIIKNRLIKEFNLDVELGPLFIAYKEMIKEKKQESFTLETKIGTTRHFVKLDITLFPNEQNNDKLEFILNKNQENASNLASLSIKNKKILNQGLVYGLSRGPKLNCPMYNVGAMLNWFETTRSTSDTLIISSVSKCINKILKNIETFILEPVMYLEIVTSEDYLSIILSDLTYRRTTILKIIPNPNNKIIECLTPLSTLQGYATDLRTITSGRANFSMQFHSYQILTKEEESKLFTTKCIFF